jgi:hypothetical protein
MAIARLFSLGTGNNESRSFQDSGPSAVFRLVPGGREALTSSTNFLNQEPNLSSWNVRLFGLNGIDRIETDASPTDQNNNQKGQPETELSLPSKVEITVRDDGTDNDRSDRIGLKRDADSMLTP